MVEKLFATNQTRQEDKQTASVFSTLLHLPDEEFWKIIKDSCYNNELPDVAGKIEFHEFWPHWLPDKNHTKYVEPDLFIRFEKIDVIIEAKRYDENQQNKNQWESENSSYSKQYSLDKREVVLIAVGGLYSSYLYPENCKNIFVEKCRWRKLLDTLYKYLEKYEKNMNNNYVRIVNDCIEYLKYFGFKKILWFNEIDNIENYFIDENSINNFLEWRIK
jgi:hypothetical protein